MENLKHQIENLYNKYNKLYKPSLTNSNNINIYGENEFYGGKREALLEVLDLIENTKHHQ